MADEFPIKAVIEVDDSKAVAEGEQAGKKIGEGIEKGAKPVIKPTIDESGIKSATDKIVEAIGKSFGDTIDRQIVASAKMFGRSIKEQSELREQAVARRERGEGLAGRPPAGEPPPPPPEPPGLAQRLAPALSGLEAVAMLFRGAPMLSVAQMVGQAITQQATLAAAQRAAAGAGGAGIPPIPPGGGGGGAAGAAAAGAAGAGLARFLPFLTQGGLAVGAATAVAAGAVKVRDSIGELGLETAKEVIQAKNLSNVMGVNIKDLAEMEIRFRSTGLSVDDIRGNINRLAVRAKTELPEINKEVERFGDKSALASIKVIEADLNLAKARDARGASADRLRQAEGELVKVQETGVDVMQQQRRAADLGVSGARIAQRGAEMQARQAAIGVQLAPQEAALADIAGPLTVEGARLGREGAALSLDEVRARIKARREGVKEDPQEREDREKRREELAERTALHNLRQANLRTQQVQLGEERRKTEQAAGLGPEAQAQQQALQAAQAKEMADLHVKQAETTRRTIEIDQEYNDIKSKRNKAERDLEEAGRGVVSATLDTQKSEIGVRDANREKADLAYHDIEQAQKLIRGEKPPEGFDVRQIDQDTLRKAFFREGEGRPGAIYDLMGKYMREQLGGLPEADRGAQEVATVGAVTGLRGLSSVPGFIAALKATERTPEQQKLVDEQIRLWEKENQEQAKGIVSQQNLNKIRVDQAEQSRGEAAFGVAPAQLEKQAQDQINLITGQKVGIQALGATGGLFDRIGRALNLSTEAQTTEALPPGKSALDMLGLQLRPEHLIGFPGLQPLGLLGILGKLGMSAGAAEFVQPPEAITKPPEEVTPEVTKPVTDASQQAGTQITNAGQQAGTAITGAGTDISGAINSAGTEAAGAVSRGGDEVAGALSEAAAKIAAIQFPSPQQVPGGGGTIEAIEEQEGGLINGPGSEQSDSIPIMASRDEFMVKASTVRKVGVPFLNALNEGRIGFQAGGVIDGTTSTPSPYQSMADAWKRELDQDFLRELARLGVVGFQRGGFIRDDDDPRKQALKHAQGVQERREAASEARKWAAWAIPIARQLQAEKAAKDAQKKAATKPDGGGGGGGSGSILSTGAGMSLPGEPPTSEFYPFVRPPPKFVEAPKYDPATGKLADPESALRSLATLRSPRKFGQEPGRVKVIQAPTVPGEFGKVVTPSGAQPFKPGVQPGTVPGPERAMERGPPKIIQAPEQQVSLERFLTAEEFREPPTDVLVPPSVPPTTEPPPTDVLVPPPPPPPEEERRREEEPPYYEAAGGLIGSLVRGFANGGLITASASAQGYTGGAAVSHTGGGGSVQGFHQLDLRTNVGNIPVAASADTIEAIRRSALSGKLSQTGPRPTWYS